MIKIKRAECPQSLQDANGQPAEAPPHYNKPDVKEALWNMQHQKCAYCEVTIKNDRSTWIEHIIPKSHFENDPQRYPNPNVKNHWTNLLYTCSVCNGNKHMAEDIINPSDPNIDPEDHLDYKICKPSHGAIIPLNNDLLGEKTINALKLDSHDLKGSRQKVHYEIDTSFWKLIHAYTRTPKNNSEVKKNIKYIISIMSADSVHAGYARTYIKKMKEKFPQKYLNEIESNLGHSVNINLNELLPHIPIGFEVSP